MAELDLPAVVYNWLVAFFAGHAHRTVYNDEVSSTRSISASIIQGCSLGSALYTVTAANLKPIIDTAVSQWRTRLRACVKALGEHFEHKL